MHKKLANLIEAGQYLATSHHNTCKFVRNPNANDCDCGKEEWEQCMVDLQEAIEERKKIKPTPYEVAKVLL